MKFYTKPLIRFCYRYVALFLFIVFPLCLSGYTEFMYGDGVWIYKVFCLFLAVCGSILVNYAFWEKFFAVLIITNDRICWKCPFRHARMILVSDCAEIGVYIENANNGIPSKHIYFSDHKNPWEGIGKNGVVKASHHLIKFWYSDELCSYIIKSLPDEKTTLLRAYRQQ